MKPLPARSADDWWCRRGLLGGYLADYVFEPFMKSGAALAGTLQFLWEQGTEAAWRQCFSARGYVVLR